MNPVRLISRLKRAGKVGKLQQFSAPKILHYKGLHEALLPNRCVTIRREAFYSGSLTSRATPGSGSKRAGISEPAPRNFGRHSSLKDEDFSREMRSMQEKQRSETEKRSSAWLRYFLAGLAILLVTSAWDAQTRHELATLKGHTDNVYSVAFSPDGKTLASRNWDHTVKLWDAQTRQELATLRGHDATVFSVAFSADGKTLASGSFDSTVGCSGVERFFLRQPPTAQIWKTSLRGI
jgi:WD40 domain-containing protein